MNKPIRNLARIIFGRILPRLAYPVIRGPLRGSKFILGTHGGEGGGSTVYFNMSEQKQTNAFVNTLKKGNALFDVGANVGYYTVLGSKLVGANGKVISLEPFVRNISYLYRHVSINKLNNVTIIPSACSDTVSLVTFLTSPNTAMGKIVKDVEINDSRVEKELTLVSTVTLDEISEKLEIMPDVLKIDVEGAELAVLQGAKKIIERSKPAIFLSVHSQLLKKQCLEYLKTLGYTFDPLGEDANTAMEFLCK